MTFLPTPRIAVIGSGLGGIAIAANLQRRGIHSFTLFEASDGAGGTWWDNRYPGAECDIPSILYSYSFRPRAWSRTHARQEEILEYVQDVVAEFGIGPHIRYGAKVDEVVWDEASQTQQVRLASGESLEFDVVVSSVGLLNVPRFPSWPGLDEFRGRVVHTAVWDESLDLRDKRVAVVGNGSSASQVIPAIAPEVASLVAFQREPAWVVPKGDRDHTAAERETLSVPWRNRLARWRTFRSIDLANATYGKPDASNSVLMREACVAHLDEHFGHDPEMKQLLTPDYPVRCKRIITSSDYIPALARDTVSVVPHGIVAATAAGVVDASGQEHEVDVIVLATGFQPSKFLARFSVYGDDKQSLHDVWGEDPKAFLGMMVPGFPNFFIQYGPNTNGGCVILQLERQAEFITRSIRRMHRTGARRIELRRIAFNWYERHLVKGLAAVSTWEANCNNYYHSASGRNVTQWPWTHARFALMSTVLRRPATKVSRRTRAGIDSGQ